MFGRTFITLQALLLIALPLSATELTLDDYVQKLSDHPQVQRILSKSEQHRELALGAMGLPNPNIILGVDNLPVQTNSFDKFLPTSKVLGFSQKFPSYKLRKAKSNQQKQLSAKQQIIANYSKKRLKAILISSLIRLNKVKKQQQYANKQIKYYKEIEEYFKGKLESGVSIYWRFSQVDVERSLVEQKLNNLTAERIEVESELARLVGEVPNLNLPNYKSKTWNTPEDLYPIKIAQEDIQVAKFGVDAASAAYRPTIGVTALYKQREDGSNFSGEDWVSVKASVSIPLWYKWNQAPKKRAALAKKSNAIESYENMKLGWIKKLSTLESKRDAALKNVHVLSHKDKALTEMISATKRTYESGETSLEALLDAKINRLSIESQLEQERFKHMSSVAEINSYIIGE